LRTALKINAVLRLSVSPELINRCYKKLSLQVITNDEAERRGKAYDSAGITYLFDLDFHDSENPLTVDATNIGNISHFVNHSVSYDKKTLRLSFVFLRTLDKNRKNRRMVDCLIYKIVVLLTC